jgi:arylsulfatase
MHWPAGLGNNEDEINSGVGHVIDILPTCLELANAKYPAQINGLSTTPVEGKSMLPLLRGEIANTHDTLFWEHEGGRALRIGDWKISALKNGAWELFDLAKDRTETNNLAKALPGKVKDMEEVWRKSYARIFPPMDKQD